MKKVLLALAIAAAPLLANAVDVNVNLGNVRIDAPGEKYYTGRGDRGGHHRDGGHCPPGQAKKGNC